MNASSILPVKLPGNFNSIVCFISTVSSGNALNKENLQTIASQSEIDFSRITTCRQVHGSSIEAVYEGDTGKRFPDTDGLVTNLINVPVAVYTADCLSIFLYAPGKEAIGIVHAGRKGTEDEITIAAVKKLSTVYGAAPTDIRVALGPCICGKCYETDMIEANTEQLLKSGVREANISVTGLCTLEEERFYSYRGNERTTDRMISIIMRRSE